MGRTPDAAEGPRLDEEAVVWREGVSEPADNHRTQFVQNKGLMTFADGVARSIGETREALWQSAVDELLTNTPPMVPVTGYRVIVGNAPIGVFVGHDGEIAQWDGSAWVFTLPRQGTSAFVKGSPSPYYQTAALSPWSWSQVSPGGFFGAELQWVKDAAYSSTTSVVFQQKIRLTTTDLPVGDYIVLWNATIEGSLASTQVEARLELDDLTVLADMKIAPGPASSVIFSGHAIMSSFSGLHTFDLDWRRSAGGGQTSIAQARITLWRIS